MAIFFPDVLRNHRCIQPNQMFRPGSDMETRAPINASCCTFSNANTDAPRTGSSPDPLCGGIRFVMVRALQCLNVHSICF